VRFTPVAVAAALVVSLTGCTQTVALQPADNAIDPLCASVVVHLPDPLVDFEQRSTNAQGTSAWGTPTSVILRCGVPEPDPTSTLPCVSADGVDWLRDDTDEPTYVFTTYGRSPAVEVIVDRDAVSPGVALYDLADAIKFTEKVRECTDVEDSLD
jgi:hypothetical protein